MARAWMHIVLRRSADACLIVPILADHPGGAARCHAVRVVRAGLPLRPCWPSGHSREQEVAGEYPYVLARKVWLYPFWAGRWPPNRSNLLPPWLEGDRLDRTTGATHWVRSPGAVYPQSGCCHPPGLVIQCLASAELAVPVSREGLATQPIRSWQLPWSSPPGTLPGPPLWGDVASGGSRRGSGSRGRVGKSPIGLHTAIRVASLPPAA